MLQIPAELLAHLEGAGTIVTPSRQRAAALRLAHSALMLASGRTLWPSPDILPWGAWVERELEQARVRGESLPRRLSAVAQWQLWREAVLQAGTGREILAPERLIDPVRRAVAVLEDHGLRPPAAASAETALLIAARTAYRNRCRELGALASDFWGECAAYLRPSAQLMLAGFGQIGSARRRWLEQQGARIFEGGASEWEACETRVSAAASPAEEAQAAADWCAERITRDPAVRLLLIVPRLTEQRHHWLRALSQRLDPLRILSPSVASASAAGSVDRSAVAIEGGRALAEHPLVATALDLIALGAGRSSREQLGALLRSAYLGAGEPPARLQLELWLREHGLDPAALEGLVRQRGAIAEQAGAAAGVLVDSLQEALQAPAEQGVGSSWAQCFAVWLERCGWPGQDLGSEEQQVRLHFDELLGELAALDPLGRGLSLPDACRLLQELATREHFEPASDDVAVTITASLDDPIVRYDGIWVAGLSADAWPRPVQIDPLIPVSLQRQAGLAGSTPALQLAQARELQSLWSRRARACVLSWAATDEDLPAEASPLLHGLPNALPAERFELSEWLAELAVPLQAWHEPRGAPWPVGRHLHGGARLLELQSLCPFRGYAELRLAARELDAVQNGVTARERGRILHRALELFWRASGDSQALRRDAATLLEHAARCAAQAVEEVSGRAPGPLASLLLARERERTQALLIRLIEWERSREPFTVQALEFSTHVSLAGRQLPLRVDRVDRLQDGRLLVIDYKSGKPQPFDGHAERPEQPQLPAYALALGEQVAAVAMLYVGRPGIGVRGVADRSGRLARLRAVPAGLDWETLRGQWHERLDILVREFVDGYAAVEPQPRACERCHLPMLCRIDALQLDSLRALAEVKEGEYSQVRGDLDDEGLADD